MSTQGRGGGGTKDEDAKYMFDRIGKDVYDKVKEEAKTYDSYLKGNLADSSIFGVELASSNNPFTFEYNKLLGARGKRHPCGTGDAKKEERFSNTLGGQCTNSKMRSDGIGACAPYRRLHLCHHNLESIDTDKIDSTKAKHKLLAEVCMAAKYEGESLVDKHKKYKETHKDTNICTVLARSFADIGDIIRGKDLYRGNNRENDKLESKLKVIFGKIHSEVTNGKNGKNLQALRDRYIDDAKGGDFFKLREDWWYANRNDVWKAITCNAPKEDHYF
ncbi:hypothetical protein PFTANZ_01305, partial [Plasmodium falciparum Tanzania (2000708)]